MSILSNNEKLNLDKMIKASNAEDNTEKIKNLKHSKLIENDIQELLKLKKEYERLAKSNPKQFDKMCENKCIFLFTNYSQIYHKVKKDNINLNLLAHFLVILRKIENNEINQHEGSVMIGKLLKEIYVDSALREGNKLDSKNNKNNKNLKKPPNAINNISYKDFKSKYTNK